MAVDKGYAWVVILGTVIQMICTAPIFQMLGLLFGPKLTEIGSTEKETSIAISVYLSMWSLSTLFVGPLVQIRGERFVSLCAAICSIAGLIMCALSRSPADFILSFGLVAGTGQGLASLNCILLVNKHFRKKVGLAMGLYVCGTGGGNFIMPQVVKVLLKNFEIQNVILIYAAICCTALLAAVLIRPDPIIIEEVEKQNTQGISNAKNSTILKPDLKASEEDKKLLQINEKSKGVNEAEDKEENKCCNFIKNTLIYRIFSMIKWSLLKSPRFVFVSFVACMLFNGILLFNFDIADICFSKGLSMSETADVITISGAAAIVFRLVQGMIGDLNCLVGRVEKPKTFVNILSAVLFSACLVGLSFAEEFSTILLCIILAQLGVAGAVVNGPLVMREYFLSDLSSAIGICNVIRSILAFVVGPITGVIKENYEGYTPTLLFLSALILLNTGAWALERALSRREADKEQKLEHLEKA